MHVLILDNYDSFTFNLAQMFQALGARATVVRSDAIAAAGVDALAPDRIVLSPGPGRPENAGDFGVCATILARRPVRVPILGVCLGHQGLVHACGGRVVHAPRPVHGKVSWIRHHGGRLFEGMPARMEVMRYHSLLAERASLPETLRITAETEGDGLIMGVEHREWPLYGVQFHPESIGTPQGSALLERFLSKDVERGMR